MQDKIPDYAQHNEFLISGFFGPYRFLSNFHMCPVEYLGVRYESTEVAYQAAKCLKEEDRLQFAGLGSSQAKKLGRKVTLHPDWEARKKQIMLYLVFQKFSRHADLRKELIATGNAILREANHWGDKYWGEAFAQTPQGNWYWVGGENHLGQILQSVRSALK